MTQHHSPAPVTSGGQKRNRETETADMAHRPSEQGHRKHPKPGAEPGRLTDPASIPAQWTPTLIRYPEVFALMKEVVDANPGPDSRFITINDRLLARLMAITNLTSMQIHFWLVTERAAIILALRDETAGTSHAQEVLPNPGGGAPADEAAPLGGGHDGEMRLGQSFPRQARPGHCLANCRLKDR